MGSWTNATRQAVRTLPPDARRPTTATTAGILRPAEFSGRVALSRPRPSAPLETWVESYWTLRWDLTGAAPYLSEVLPHPAVHVTVESGTSPHHGFPMPAGLVTGVPTQRFSFEAVGEGRVFGVKFRPGGFGAFTGADVAALTGRMVAAETVFGETALVADVLAQDADTDRTAVLDAFLTARIPDPDPRYEQLLEIVAGMVADSALISVDAVCARFDLAPRTLQRLFRRYVGVGPKWVLRRYRLHDAVTLVDAGERDLAGLAARLGWFDQAHFTREFTEQVGVSPTAYARRTPR